MGTEHAWRLRLAAWAAACGVLGWMVPYPGTAGQGLPQPGGPAVELPGLHNVIQVSDRLYSGSSPEGDAGFESLRKLGVKTVVSVDGARPDVARAAKVGLRYVHLPIGYDGISQEQAVQLAKAVRDLPGPVYLHCHHGKHRGPAAAAVVLWCLDEKCTAAQAVAVMKRAGTDPRYSGLYAAPGALRRPTAAELDRAKAEFPEAAAVPALAQAMVRIDEHFDHLTLIKKAGWKVPKDHPDLDPPHEALQLVEHFTELARQPAVAKRPDEFRGWLGEAEGAARDLEKALRALGKEMSAAAAAEQAFERSRALCARCHARYRDVPQKE
jgi:protein tyrosine phosphatase (PTP) superfamily phosphohydrolase (DUF442 family)